MMNIPPPNARDVQLCGVLLVIISRKDREVSLALDTGEVQQQE